MQWDDIYISAAAAELGRVEQVRDAVAEGRYDAEECDTDDYQSVRIVDDERSAVDLAVAAATEALERAGTNDFGLLLHASVGHQGMDHFTPASYVHSKIGGGLAPALEVRQSSNGGMAALDVAAAYLSAMPAISSALVTTGDKFAPPAYDRYRTDQGMIMSDGGTAVVLSRTGGVAKLLSTALLGDPLHGEAYVGTDSWTDVSGARGWPIDLRVRKVQHLEAGGNIWEIVEHLTTRQQEVVNTALADAKSTVDEIARFVFPNVGRSVQDWKGRGEVGITEERTTWAWGRTVGHLGGGDQVAGLTHLIESGQVRTGDKVVLAGIGSGWNYSAAVVEIVAEPSWQQTAA